MKEQNQAHRIFSVIAVTLFVGLILTVSVFCLTESFVGEGVRSAESCFDGSRIEGDGFFARFSRTVYQSKKVLSAVREAEYHLFGVVEDANVLCGRRDFLFEIRDEQNDYDYLRDYVRGTPFDAEQSAAILAELQRREADYRARGAQYLLIILPNAQTVYSEYMPVYLGSISKHTRLAELDDYLAENGFDSYVDLTEELRARKDDGLLYNNTENSLNALGLYYTYLAIYDRFSPTVMANTTPLSEADLDFYLHLTSGRRIARDAGLETVVYNRTVSLSNDTRRNYSYSSRVGYATKTVLIPTDYRRGADNDLTLLLQFSGNWERLQSEPFFSNTFGRVTYQTGLADNETVFNETQPQLIIQFIYENELSALLPADD